MATRLRLKQAANRLYHGDTSYVPPESQLGKVSDLANYLARELGHSVPENPEALPALKEIERALYLSACSARRARCAIYRRCYTRLRDDWREESSLKLAAVEGDWLTWTREWMRANRVRGYLTLLGWAVTAYGLGWQVEVEPILDRVRLLLHCL